MKDYECISFLQWALPRLNLRWQGFRRVRKQVCKRISQRMTELRLTGISAYRAYLEKKPEEWDVLNRMCRITISRFYRDRFVFDCLTADALPALIDYFRMRNHSTFKVWSCGCASGEEPYTMAIIWHYMLRHQYSDVRLEITATDIDPVLVKRARRACYTMSSIRFIPDAWRNEAFTLSDGNCCLRELLKQYVHFDTQDIREKAPDGKFHVVLCRNLAFTYFEQSVQESILKNLSLATEQGGILVIGRHESIPVQDSSFEPWGENLPIFRKRDP